MPQKLFEKIDPLRCAKFSTTISIPVDPLMTPNDAESTHLISHDTTSEKSLMKNWYLRLQFPTWTNVKKIETKFIRDKPACYKLA